MADKLPTISGYETIKALTKLGFVVRRQRGSHVVMQRDRIIFTVPLHKTLKRGTLHAILKQAGVSGEEFKKLM